MPAPMKWRSVLTGAALHQTKRARPNHPANGFRARSRTDQFQNPKPVNNPGINLSNSGDCFAQVE